jgi:hypothetical protein
VGVDDSPQRASSPRRRRTLDVVDRYLVDAGTDHDAALHAALNWAAAYAITNARDSAAVLVGAIDMISSLGEVLGSNGASTAMKSRWFVHAETTFDVFAPRTTPHRFDGPIVVPWASLRMIETAEAMMPPAVCATPWIPGELADWTRAYGPIDPRNGQATATDDIPGATRGFVRGLTEYTGGGDVVHPSDKARAIEGLKALKLAGPGIDPVLIRAVALEFRWTSSAADRLRTLAKQVAEGSPVRGGKKINKSTADERIRQFVEWADRPLG